MELRTWIESVLGSGRELIEFITCVQAEVLLNFIFFKGKYFVLTFRHLRH